jgi:NOL1/NOP2/sun family putative RNA methylase
MNNTSIFLDRYRQLGAEFSNFKPVQCIRTNTLKITNEDLRERLHQRGIVLSKIPYARDGFFVARTRFSVSASIEHLQGLFYIQESASQIPVEVLNPEENELVLDMTAAPGGKTTQMAQYMNNKGCIVACDIKKVEELKNNLERLGVQNCIVYNMDALKIRDLGLEFDKILLDAPCSGNYLIDRDWFEKRTIAGIEKGSQLQRQLLSAAVSVLKKDGVLVYSTCSLEPEENELVVDWALKSLDVRLEPISNIGSNGLVNVFGKELNNDIKRTKRFWPYKTGTQGFFIAKFRKN